jgi:predicted HAD superfamily Cof-like phosphohydrolase
MDTTNHGTPEWLNLVQQLGGHAKVVTKCVTIKHKHPEDNTSLISVPVDKLFELYGNLILAGFDKDEAILIVVGIAQNARTN